MITPWGAHWKWEFLGPTSDLWHQSPWGWVPGMCISKGALWHLIRPCIPWCLISTYTLLMHSQAASPWSGLRALPALHCPLLDLFLVPSSCPTCPLLQYIILLGWGDMPTFVGVTHASSYFLTRASFWVLLWGFFGGRGSRNQECPETHQIRLQGVR